MVAIAKMMLLFFILLPSPGLAEVREITAEGAYNMGDGETPTIAESRALLNAKRVALEQAGTYIESYSKVQNFQLTQDEIQAISAGIMEVTILDKKRTMVGDGISFWVKILAKVNTGSVEAMMASIRDKEKSNLQDFKQVRDDFAKLAKELDLLKKQLKEAVSEKEKKQVESKINNEERLFQAKTWYEKGKKHDLNKEVDNAIEAYTSAITLDPDYGLAYRGRGVNYGKKGLHEKAFADFSKALLLDPNDAVNHNNRGVAYGNLGQIDKAIEDYSQAIRLNPPYVLAYVNRGLNYMKKGRHETAIEDYNRALQLDPKNAAAYNNRGAAYANSGQTDQAIEDYSRAIALNPQYALAYQNRALNYAKKGRHEAAIEDYGRAIALDSKNARNFYNRGVSYQKMKNRPQAIEDYKTAARMGHPGSQTQLSKMGETW